MPEIQENISSIDPYTTSEKWEYTLIGSLSESMGITTSVFTLEVAALAGAEAFFSIYGDSSMNLRFQGQWRSYWSCRRGTR